MDARERNNASRHMTFKRLKRWMLPAAGGMLGAVVGPLLFGGPPAIVAGAGLGATTGIALAWLLSDDSLSATWQRVAHMLVRIAFVLIVVTVIYGLVAGALTVVLYRPEVNWETYNRLYQIQGLGMLFVWILSLPALLTGVWYGSRRRWPQAGPWFLVFFGPVLLFVAGDGLTPHMEIPWHQVVHSLFGTLPLTVLYALALRKWNPAIVRFG